MILAFFSVQENVNTCSSILFLSILNPLSVHSQSGGGGGSWFQWLITWGQQHPLIWQGALFVHKQVRWQQEDDHPQTSKRAPSTRRQCWHPASSLQDYEKTNVCYLSLPNCGVWWRQPELTEMVSTFIIKLWAPWRWRPRLARLCCHSLKCPA